MMYTVRTLDGTLQDTLDVAFRKINFDDEGAIVTASSCAIESAAPKAG